MSSGPTNPASGYQVRVRGHLGATLRLAFADFELATDGDDTVLSGPIRDQAQLHGLLTRIEELGLVLLEVRCLEL